MVLFLYISFFLMPFPKHPKKILSQSFHLLSFVSCNYWILSQSFHNLLSDTFQVIPYLAIIGYFPSHSMSCYYRILFQSFHILLKTNFFPANTDSQSASDIEFSTHSKSALLTYHLAISCT